MHDSLDTHSIVVATSARPPSGRHALGTPELAIRTFGRTHVEARGHSLDGQWLCQRAGQILKYLVCQRDTIAMADEIAESIWPGKGQRAISNTRHVIHRLRDTLEPLRLPHERSSYIVALGGGYTLDRDRMWLDVDEFERAIQRGTAAAQRGDTETAARDLQRGIDLYRGEFLADEPYADWAYDERGRLGGQARHALRILVALAQGRNDREAACSHLKRLADLEPLDSDVCRDLLTALLQDGKRSEAKRRYMGFANRLRREFGEDPDFDLRALAAASTGRLSDRAPAGSPQAR